MSIIYEPQGRAAEYSPLAANPYYKIKTTGEKSYNCQEDNDFPVADTYIYFHDYIVNRQEEATNVI